MAEDNSLQEDFSRVNVRNVNILNSWLRGSNRAREILMREGEYFTEDELDWNRLNREGCDMFKPFGKDFVGISDPDDETMNLAATEDAGDSFEVGASAREVDVAVVEQSEEFKRHVQKVMDDAGTEISLDKACLEIRRGELRKMTERNARVQGRAKNAGNRAPTVSLSGETVSAGDTPLLVFVSTKTCSTIAVALAEYFTTPNGETGLFEIDVNQLEDPGTIVHVQIMKMVVRMKPLRAAGEEVGRAEVLGDEKDNEAQLLFSPRSFLGDFDVKGPVCRLLNPETEEIDGSTCYMFEASTLSVVGDMFWSELSQNENTNLLPKSTSLILPYLNDAGLPFYIAPGTEVGSPAASTTRNSEQTVKCSLTECGETLKVNVMRQHMGAHLLHERPKFNAVMPCGFCGGESAQKSSDLSQLSGCAIWLLNGQPRMHCKLLGGDAPKYSMKSAEKCTSSSPCTNRPMQCPLCPKKPGVVHWKLNMPAHWERNHNAAPLPDEFASLLETSLNEMDLTRKFLKNQNAP